MAAKKLANKPAKESGKAVRERYCNRLRPCIDCKEELPNAAYHSTQAARCKLCAAERAEKKRQGATEKRAIARVAQTHVRTEGKKIANKESQKRRHAQQERARRRSKKQVAGQELARRELLRRSLINFTVAFTPNYEAGWVHKLICAKLEKFSRDAAAGKSPRLMLFLPPRSGKSEIASKKFPAWHLGHHPDHEIIASSYAVSLPLGFSRHIKGVLKDPAYKAVFEDTKLDPNAQATDGWLTTESGGYLPAGVGGGITGKGAHILIVDDPVKDAEEADSETQRDKVWDWWGSTARTRVAPGGGILVIQCMTGDTPVLMANNTEKLLRDIRVGDEVATYDEGKLVSSFVRNWINQGPDKVFIIRMSSGRTVKANGRHPFLTENKRGELEWVQTKNLLSTQKIVVVKGSGGSGKVRSARKKSVINPLAVGDSAHRTTTKLGGPAAGARRLATKIRRRVLALSSSVVMVLRLRVMNISLESKVEGALFARRPLKTQRTQNTGTTCSALTTATSLAKSVDCYATDVIWPSEERLHQRFLTRQRPIYDFILDEIVSIEPTGAEDVFDIQVDRTENFIANGLVASNTRWHDADLAGKLLMQQEEKEKELQEQLEDTQKLLGRAQDARVIKTLGGRVERIKFQIEHEVERWEVLTFPAINTASDEYWFKGKIMDHYENGARLLRKKNSALHPERYDEIALAKIRNGLQKRHWSALYQQNPVPDEGVYFRKEMFRYEPYISSDIWGRWNIFIAWDLAIGQKQANDWTVGLVGAHDYEDRLHILDMVRVKTDELAETMITTALPYKKQLQMMGLERGQIQMAVMPSLKKLMKKKRFFISFDEELTPITDKSARARPAQAWMQSGRILLPEGQPWVDTLTAELLRFPGGVHDDIVDSLAWLVRMVLRHEPPKQKKHKKPKSWKDKLKKYTVNDHRGGGAMDA